MVVRTLAGESGALVDSSIARTPSVPSQLIAPAAGPRVETASECATMSSSTRVSTRAGPSSLGGTWKTVGRARPLRVTVAMISVSVGQNGPARLSAIQPVRSVSAH